MGSRSACMERTATSRSCRSLICYLDAASTSIIAVAKAAGFSCGTKCPAPSSIRLSTSFGNDVRSAVVISGAGRPNASSPPCRTTLGTSIGGRLARRCSTSRKRDSPCAVKLRCRYEWTTQSTKSGFSNDAAVSANISSLKRHVGDHSRQSSSQNARRFCFNPSRPMSVFRYH